MKLTVGLILLTTISSFGQALNEGTIRFGNKTVNTITTTLDTNSIDSLINRLRKDLGPEEENNDSEIAWFKIEKPNWSKDKVKIKLSILQEGADLIVSISCLSSKGKDLLQPKTTSLIEIKKYFEDKLTN